MNTRTAFKALVALVLSILPALLLAVRNPLLAFRFLRVLTGKRLACKSETPWGTQSLINVMRDGSDNTKYAEALRLGTIPALVTYSDMPTNKTWHVEYKGVTTDCKGTCGMRCDGCYAEGMITRGPKVRAIRISWARHTWCMRHDRLNMFAGICKRLATLPDGSIVRLYAAGDFSDQECIDLWEVVVRLFPRLKFFGYTKRARALDFSRIQSLPNFNVVTGLIRDPETGKLLINYGSYEDMLALAKRTGAHLCLCDKKDAEGKNAKICMSTCFECLHRQDILFIIH